VTDEIEEARRVLRTAPENEEALRRLLAALDRAGDPGTPEEAVARSNLAETTRRRGNAGEAVAQHRIAIERLPGFGGARFNLGVALGDLGRHAEAANAFAEAVRLMPDFGPARVALGSALAADGRWAKAEATLTDALRRAPGTVAAWINRGAARAARGDHTGAGADARTALLLLPASGEGWANLGDALNERGDLASALGAFERALVAGLPDEGGVLARVVQLRRRLVRWDGLEALSRRLVELVRDGRSERVHPWIFLGEGAGRGLERDCARAYSAWRTRGVVPLPPLARRVSPERLRVGWLSADFQEHATAVLIAEVIERFDRTRFELIAYSTAPDDGGPMRRRLVRAFDRFVDLSTTPDREAAERIRADGVDLLVDLKGHTKGDRLGVLTRRPAPVQVTWLGYPGTTGADFIDFSIADPVTIPVSHARDHTERVVRLPWCYQPADTTRPVAETPSRRDLGLPDDAVVLCAFNAVHKIQPAVLDIWARILRTRPRTVLWPLDDGEEASNGLLREIRTRGVDPERVILAPRLPGPEHLARHRAADLFIDTFPVGAHTTAQDALWAGLPVVTLLGDSFAGRVAASILRAVGVGELALGSVRDYETAILRLIDDEDARNAFRTRIAASRGGAPMWDTPGFTRALEEALERIHTGGS